jgi:adenosylmethionine-8-amino-7-oxononanoate aminotransferase
MAFTCGSAVMILSALMTFSGLELLEFNLVDDSGDLLQQVAPDRVQAVAKIAERKRGKTVALARASCTRYGVHLIADEIMTGFGRTGTMFACEQAPIEPDFLCLSKGLTGGYLPLSVVLTNDEIYAAFYDDELARGFLHSHSYTGNALACRAALAVLDLFRDEDVIAANRARAKTLSALARPLAAHPKTSGFRHLGMIWAFEVDTRREDFASWCFSAALEREMLLRPIGRTIYWMPPYCLSDDEMALLAARTLDIVACA